MKSLSPNAQEFIPYKFMQYQQQQQQQLHNVQPQTFITGTTSPVVIGYQYAPTSVPPPPPPPNQFYHPNQNIPLQIFMPPPPPPPPPQYNQTFQFIPTTDSSLLTSPSYIITPYQINYPPHTQNYIKNTKKINNKKHNNINNNTMVNNNNNNNNNSSAEKKPVNIDLNDNEWPSLVDSELKKEPYIKDEVKFKKVLTNVNFIKQTIEQHYLYETSQKLNFKNAVLSTNFKPQDQQHQQQQQSTINYENTTSSNNLSQKSRRKRSKSNNKSNDQSAYSTDETLDANNQTNSKPDQQQQQNKKKFLQPITIEFANMISALEKSQQQQDNKKSEINKSFFKKFTNNPNIINKSFKNLTSSVLMVQKVPQQLNTMNPLDSNAIIKRGKEREKPKTKKKSTLKKIILREREEKRKQREDNKLSQQLSLDLNSPAPNLSDLFMSPKSSISPKNVSNESKNDTDSENRNEETKEQEESIENQEDKEEEEEEEGEDENVEQSEVIDNLDEISSPISQQSPISINAYTPSPYQAMTLVSNDLGLKTLEKLEEKVKQKIHTRKFREYCNQIINKDIDQVCSALLHEIVRFQDRMYHKNPIKAKMRRRYVMGIREVTKHLKLQKLKCVILAPNCEKIESKGGLDDAINFIIQTSMEQNIPFLFALGRKGLGKAVNKLVPISVIGIFDYSGAEEYFRRLVELANNAKLAYQEMVEEFEREECENLIMMQSNVVNTLNPPETSDETNNKTSLTSGLLNNHQINQVMKPSHWAHSRTPSNGSNISIEPYYLVNYHTHSRSASGNFNYGHTTVVSGHSRSASGGGLAALNIDLSNKHWTHSRTPSNCSNISFISRLSEPISEVGMSSIINSNSTYAAVQYYTEQVRQEMKEGEKQNDNNHNQEETKSKDECDNSNTSNVNALSSSLGNLHLGCINEIDAGNEADTEDLIDESKSKLNKLKSTENL